MRGAQIDRALGELAARQHGVVALAQLHRLGLGTRGAEHRVAAGRLHPVYRGVYAVGHHVLSTDGRRMAAVLVSGPGAVLSHRSAAGAWGIRQSSRVVVDVTTPKPGRRSPAGIDLHWVRTWVAEDSTTLRGISITSPSRTLIDLAGVLTVQALDRAVHETEVLGLLDVAAIEAVLARASGRRGTRALRAVLASPSPGPTRSRLEERFLALCRAAQLPTPVLNRRVATSAGAFEVDALWRDERVIVELDGAAAHDTRRAFHADRRRDAALAAQGYVVVRLTWDRVTADAAAVAGEVHRLLALRR